MTIVSTDDVKDGLPRIAGTEVTVLDVYKSYAREGNEPTEVAHELGVDLPRVHEALAFYYDHAERMRELEGRRNPKPSDRLEIGESGKDEWGPEPVPDNAGEALFGDLNGDESE